MDITITLSRENEKFLRNYMPHGIDAFCSRRINEQMDVFREFYNAEKSRSQYIEDSNDEAMLERSDPVAVCSGKV